MTSYRKTQNSLSEVNTSWQIFSSLWFYGQTLHNHSCTHVFSPGSVDQRFPSSLKLQLMIKNRLQRAGCSTLIGWGAFMFEKNLKKRKEEVLCCRWNKRRCFGNISQLKWWHRTPAGNCSFWHFYQTTCLWCLAARSKSVMPGEGGPSQGSPSSSRSMEKLLKGGWLKKQQRGLVKNWQQRYVVLRGNSLTYYKDDKETTLQVRPVCLSLIIDSLYLNQINVVEQNIISLI